MPGNFTKKISPKMPSKVRLKKEYILYSCTFEHRSQLLNCGIHIQLRSSDSAK